MKGNCSCLRCVATAFNVYDDEDNTYAMYVENDGGFKVFDVVEDILGSLEADEDEVDVPMSPCTRSELDPDRIAS